MAVLGRDHFHSTQQPHLGRGLTKPVVAYFPENYHLALRTFFSVQLFHSYDRNFLTNFMQEKKFFLKVMFVYVLFYFTVITLILRLKTSFFTSINIKNHLTEQKRTLQVWVFCDVIKAWYDAFWKEMWKHLKEMCQDNKVNLISWFGVPSR